MSAIVAKKVRFARDMGSDPIQGALYPWQTVVIEFSNVAGKNPDPISCQIVRLYTSEECHVAFGDVDVVATTSDCPLREKVAEYFILAPKQYISAINASGSNNNKLHVTIMT
jgi:hypothetical protein